MIPAEVMNTSKGAVVPLEGMTAYWESRDINHSFLTSAPDGSGYSVNSNHFNNTSQWI